MPGWIQATIILATWAVLLALYAVNRYGLKSRFLKDPIVVTLASSAAPDFKADSFLSRAGTLVVFMANIATFGLVFLLWLSPSTGRALSVLRLALPFWVQAVGGVLFVLYSFWGLLVLFFNPNYTPLYKNLRGRYVIATEGPYRWVRHPRYAAEAVLNVALFLFTGFWTPLLGLCAWPALYAQARDEERLLLMLAPDAYGAYRQTTGMFFLKLRRTGVVQP